MKGTPATFIITDKQAEQLRKMAYVSRKTMSALVREAIDLLIKSFPKVVKS